MTTSTPSARVRVHWAIHAIAQARPAAVGVGPGEITTRQAGSGPRPTGRAGFDQAIAVGRAGAGLLPRRTDPGQGTPHTRGQAFHEPHAGIGTSTNPASKPQADYHETYSRFR